MYALLVVEGPDAGARFPLPEREPQLIGRSTEAVPLHDASVSRRHAELTPDAGRWWLRDLESRNGTYLNDMPILERSPLTEGDRVRCGDTVMQLVHLDDPQEHGRIREPVVERDAVRILSSPSIPATRLRQLHALLGPTSGTPTVDLPLICRLVGADAAALVETHGSNGELGAATLRRVDQRSPDTAFDLPRTLVQATMRDGTPKIAVIDDSDSVAAIFVRTSDDGGVILAVSRTAESPWKTDELELLAVAATTIAMTHEQRREIEDLGQLQKLAAMGEATAALSHAVRNIVQGLRGGTDAVELALHRERLDLAREGWAILSRNLDRILALSLDMLAYSKDRELDLRSTDVGRLVTDAVDLLRTSAERSKVLLELDLSSNVPPVALDPDALHQIVINLVRNAIDATPPRGRVVIRSVYDPETPSLVVEVLDQGPGVPPERQERIFEPFFSTKGQRGTGLGLAVARKLAERHGGSLYLEGDPGSGARFRLVLPADREPDADPEKTRGPNPIQGGDLGVRFEA